MMKLVIIDSRSQFDRDKLLEKFWRSKDTIVSIDRLVPLVVCFGILLIKLELKI